MTQKALKENPDFKAWKLVEQMLNDQEKYHRLRYEQKFIELDGSAGGRYFLYPNGEIVRLGEEQAHLGRGLRNGRMAFPDVLATIILWITKKEPELLEQWKCGNLDVLYERPNSLYQNHDVVRRMARHRQRNFTSFLTIIPIIVAMMIAIAISPHLLSTMQNLNSTTLSTSSSNSSSVWFSMNDAMIFILNPIFIIAIMAGFMLYFLKTMMRDF